MNRDWLWDRKINISKAKKILKNSQHKNFIMLASLLLARKNNPEEVFKEYLDPILFYKKWTLIKRYMRKDEWNNQRIIFWQTIYEKLNEKYLKKGIRLRKSNVAAVNELCKNVGKQIRDIRKEQKLSQKILAKRLGVSQQLISRIERGQENVSLVTLSNIFNALNKKLSIG